MGHFTDVHIVPIFDGTREFNLAAYSDLPSVQGEIAVGSAVLVIFTVSRYDMTAQKMRQYGLDGAHKHALSFNVLSVVVLATPDERSTIPPAPLDAAHAYGVLISDDVVSRDAIDEEEEDEGSVMM